MKQELSELFLKYKEVLEKQEKEFGDLPDSKDSIYDSVKSLPNNRSPIESKSFQLHCVKAIDSERMGESPYLKANSLMIEDDDALTMSRTDLSVLWQQQTTFKAKLKNYLLKLVKSPENQMYSEVQQHRIEILFHRVLSL